MCFVRQAPTAIRHHHLVYRSRLAKSNDKSIKSVNFRFSHIDAKHEILFSATHRHVAAWSRGMIPPSGGGGRGFDSRSGPAVVTVRVLVSNDNVDQFLFFSCFDILLLSLLHSRRAASLALRAARARACSCCASHTQPPRLWPGLGH